MRESGLYTKWLNNVLLHYHNKIGNIIDLKPKVLCEYNSLTIVNIKDLFYLLLFGILIGMLMTLGEFICRIFSPNTLNTTIQSISMRIPHNQRYHGKRNTKDGWVRFGNQDNNYNNYY